MELWTIYRKEDAIRNQRFIDYLNRACEKYKIKFVLKFWEDFPFEGRPDVVINRTNDFLISEYFEKRNIRCFNSSSLTKIANDKNLCYQYMASNNIRIQRVFNDISKISSFPVVFKNPLGRGGNEVFLINDLDELKLKIKEYPYYTIQEFLKAKMPRDLRVYVIGNKIIKGLVRIGTHDFRANYSLSKQAKIYNFKDEELNYIQRIIDLFDVDYAGFDFLLDDDNNLIFNEIEDSVGARALYELTDVDIATLYIEYIYTQLVKEKEE